MRYSDALANPDCAEGKFSPQQNASVIDPLMVARQQPPSLPAAY
jgi:hypothetical protein